MKKGKKQPLMIIISVTVVISVLASAAIFFLLNGNSVNKGSLQEVIETSWNTDDGEMPGFVAAFSTRSNFKVLDFTDEGEGYYTVSVEVTSPDILNAIIEYQASITEFVSEQEMDAQIVKMIDSAEMKTTVQTLSVTFTDDEPHVTYTEEFIDAMYGYSYIYCMNEFSKITSFQ